MTVPAALLHALAWLQLRQDPRQQLGLVEQLEAALHLLRDEQLGEFLPDSLHRDHGRLQPPCVRLDRRFHGGIERKLQDGGEADRPQHPQRIFIEGRRGLERSHDASSFQVLQPSTGEIEHRPVPIHQQAVDGKVAAHHVVPQGARADLRLSTARLIGLDAARHEFEGAMIQIQVRGAESLEDHRGPQLQDRAHRRRQLGGALAVDQDVNLADGPGALAA